MTTSIATDYNAAYQMAAEWKAKGECVVFTNGVFDLIHAGHTHYLAEAAREGTKLIVALNSDASTKRLGKGPHRPINDEQSRAMVLTALRAVDLVVIFEEDTPLEVIKAIQPDVLVKGGDYRIDQIVGATEVLEWGGRVKQLSFLKGYSTTEIEQRILDAGLNDDEHGH
jgi:rfaE bifunctional protein nucleotidyltransferase chain/domain